MKFYAMFMLAVLGVLLAVSLYAIDNLAPVFSAYCQEVNIEWRETRNYDPRDPLEEQAKDALRDRWLQCQRYPNTQERL